MVNNYFGAIDNNVSIISITSAASIIFLLSNYSSIRKVIQCQIQCVRLTAIARRAYKDSLAKTEQLNNSEEDRSDDSSENTNEISVCGIHIHPIKSLRPISVQSSNVTRFGLEGDRNLMIVRPSYSISSTGPTHRFVTQRQCPALATIDASLPTPLVSTQDKKTVIQLSHASLNDKVFIDITPSVLRSNPVRYHAGIWEDTVEVVDVGDNAARFVQKIMKNEEDSFEDVRVVSIIPQVTKRRLDERYVPLVACEKLGIALPQTSLQDGFPILLASEESLEELNKRLCAKGKDELPMSRFRPNIVVRGLKKAFEEDEWKAIQIGGKNGPIFHIVKGCPRCKQSCTDQVSHMVKVFHFSIPFSLACITN